MRWFFHTKKFFPKGQNGPFFTFHRFFLLRFLRPRSTKARAPSPLFHRKSVENSPTLWITCGKCGDYWGVGSGWWAKTGRKLFKSDVSPLSPLTKSRQRTLPKGRTYTFRLLAKFFSRGCMQAISWGLVVAGAYIGGGAVVFSSEDFGCARYGGCAFATYIIEGSLKFWRKMAAAWEKPLKVSWRIDAYIV